MLPNDNPILLYQILTTILNDNGKRIFTFKNNNLVNYEKYSGDVTGDGYINVGDAAKLYGYIKKRISSLEE